MKRMEQESSKEQKKEREKESDDVDRLGIHDDAVDDDNDDGY